MPPCMPKVSHSAERGYFPKSLACLADCGTDFPMLGLRFKNLTPDAQKGLEKNWRPVVEVTSGEPQGGMGLAGERKVLVQA